MAIDSYEQAAALPAEDLTALLASGRPEQRVWAIWALALRAHGGVVEIAQHAGREPNAGVRRTLAVILASHGETDLLVALARHDPAIEVRASAIQLVTRLAAGGAIAPQVVLDAAGREPAIRIAILGAIDRGAPAFLVDLALEQLTAGSAELQLEAAEALSRTDAPAARPAVLAWLRRLDPPRAGAACRRLGARLPEDVLASALATAPKPVRAAVLAGLDRPRWATAAKLIGGNADLFAEAVERRDIEVPVAAFARVVLEGNVRYVERLHRRLAELDAAPPDLVPLLPALRRSFAEQVAALDAELAALDAELAQRLESAVTCDDETWYWECVDNREWRSAARDRLASLLGQLERF